MARAMTRPPPHQAHGRSGLRRARFMVVPAQTLPAHLHLWPLEQEAQWRAIVVKGRPSHLQLAELVPRLA